MTRFADRFRSVLGPLVIVVAFVAIMVPTCQMIDCNGMMGMPHFGMGLTFQAGCPGTVVMSNTPVGVVPAGADSLLLTLVGALVVAAFVFMPPVSVRTVRVIDAMPPPPPEDPLGARFRV